MTNLTIPSKTKLPYLFIPHYSIITALKRLLFIYQQEFYVTNELLKFAYSKRYFTEPAKRQTLQWTKFKKVQALFIVTLLLYLLLFIGAILHFWWYQNFIFFLIYSGLTYMVSFYVLPLLLITANIYLLPLDFYLKQNIINTAKEKLSKHKSHLTIIGITGSFGKTSVKELLYQLLSPYYSVITTTGNKNTPLGFAEWVDNINYSHQFLLVEMGAYQIGDIKEMCELVTPDYGVLTGINEQHLSRFKDIKNTIKAKNELSQYLAKSSVLWVNGKNKTAVESASMYAKCAIEYYNDDNITNIDYLDQGQQLITFNSGINIKSNYLASYFPMLVDLAFKVGKHFKLSPDQIKKALENMHPAEHRLYPIYYPETDLLIIDDAFNGNPDGAEAAIATLGHFKNKYRIYLTPGLVELADKTAIIHEKIGKNLAFNANEVWLIRNQVTDYIINGLKQVNFPENKIKIFNKDIEAHLAIKNQVPAGSVVLLQNDWTDNYYQ